MMQYSKISLLLLAITLWLGACESPKPVQEPEVAAEPLTVFEEGNRPERELNVAFVVVDGIYNSELMAPYDIFQHSIFHTEPGMKVFTVGRDLEPVRSFEGLRLLPDYAFDSPDLPLIDVLVVASAEHSMDTDLEDEALIDFVKQQGEMAAFVLSLCDGAFVLAKAGLVEGYESTTFPSDIARYREMFPSLTVHEGVSFVHDRKLITSAGGAKSYDAALYLTEYLYGAPVAQGIGRGLVIDWKLSDYAFVKVP